MATCRHCGLKIDFYKGYWWSSNDDFMCPDGETQHEPSD